MSPRRVFYAVRRAFDPVDGRVGRRLRAGGAMASATRALSLASAAERLRSWDRCSEAATVSTPSTSRPDRRCTARSRRVGERTGEAARSQDSSTRESVVLTDCPPGTLDRENRQRNSPSGITTEGRTCRSPGTPPAFLTAGHGHRATLSRSSRTRLPRPWSRCRFGPIGCDFGHTPTQCPSNPGERARRPRRRVERRRTAAGWSHR